MLENEKYECDGVDITDKMVGRILRCNSKEIAPEIKSYKYLVFSILKEWAVFNDNEKFNCLLAVVESSTAIWKFQEERKDKLLGEREFAGLYESDTKLSDIDSYLFNCNYEMSFANYKLSLAIQDFNFNKDQACFDLTREILTQWSKKNPSHKLSVLFNEYECCRKDAAEIEKKMLDIIVSAPDVNIDKSLRRHYREWLLLNVKVTNYEACFNVFSLK